MLQKLMAKTLDNLSYAYLATKPKRPSTRFHDVDLESYIEKHNITDPYEFFANPGTVPDVTITKTARRMGYNLMDFHFESFVETPHKVNNTVHGKLYEIEDRPDAPAMIVLHGWQMESYFGFDYYCRLLVRQGYNAVLVELPYHMHRRAPKSSHGEFTFSDDATLTIKVMKQSVNDVEATINWMKDRGASKIGTFGVSYGGMMAGLTGCVDPSVEFMMLVVPPVNLYEFFTNTRLGARFRRRNKNMYEEVKKNRELFERISLEFLKPKTSPDNIMIVMAEYDEMVSPAAIDRLWYAWERPHIERYVHGHLSVMAMNPSLTHHMRHWLKNFQERQEQQD